ncbi:MAG: hypothetical protein IT226_08955 [Flavobacteriales bacterium]|nr:hypothetical protein [Flavobacteriales bacterium]
MRFTGIAPVRAYIALGHVLFAALGVLAWMHWRERTLQLDSACQIFKWIQDDGLQIEAHRYTAVLPQLLVKLFAGAGASLKTLLLTASLAHVLLPWMIYSVIVHVLRRPWIGIAMAVAAVLCTRLAFYGVVLEVNYLLSYPFLFAAFLAAHAEDPDRRWPKVFALGSLILVLLVHPVGSIVALFIVTLYFIGATERGWLVVLAVIIIGWALFGRMILPPTGYEQGLYGAVWEGLGSLRRGADQPALDFLLGHTWAYTTHYMALWALLAVLTVVLVRKRSWAMLALVWVGMIGFILLNITAYHKGESAMMMEKNFLPLAVMVALPLVMEVGKWNTRSQFLSWIPFALVLFLQFRGMSFASREVHERLFLLEELVSKARSDGAGKALVETHELDTWGLHIHWALGYETILISAVDHPENATVIYATDKQLLGAPIVSHSFPITDLDPQWFRVPIGNEHVLSLHSLP